MITANNEDDGYTPKPDAVGVSSLSTGSAPSFTGYKPELWTMRKDDIYAARMALTDGIAYTRELLANHDRDLGRNHRSNKIAAEHMEKAIAAMQCALIGLRPTPAESLGDIAVSRTDTNT
jgi:hypothetical protein